MKNKAIKVILAVLMVGGGIWWFQNSFFNSKQNIVEALGLDSYSTKELIEHLESNKEIDVLAQINGESLYLTNNKNQQQKIKYTSEDFYLSVAPYVEMTHPCIDHVLTGCQGEMVKERFDVKILNKDGELILDTTVTTNDNGFFGLWLPRDQELSIIITNEVGSAVENITTYQDSNTCLTTMQLS